MANTDAPNGLTPVMHKSGAPYNGSVNPYVMISTYATAAFVGDVVIRVAGGSNTAKITTPTGSFEIGTLPDVEKATLADGNSATGVIVGFGANPDNLSLQYRAASTERLVWVCDDPDVVFEVQANGAIPAASIGLNGILIATHSGSTVTGRSGLELDTTGTAPSADASNMLTITRAVNRTDVDTTLTHAKVLVRINQHTESAGVVGI